VGKKARVGGGEKKGEGELANGCGWRSDCELTFSYNMLATLKDGGT